MFYICTFSDIPRVHAVGVPQAVQEQIKRAHRLGTEMELAAKDAQNPKMVKLMEQLLREDIICQNTLLRIICDMDEQLSDAQKKNADLTRRLQDTKSQYVQMEQVCAKLKRKNGRQYYKTCSLCGKQLDNKYNYRTHHRKCKKDHKKSFLLRANMLGSGINSF